MADFAAPFCNIHKNNGIEGGVLVGGAAGELFPGLSLQNDRLPLMHGNTMNKTRGQDTQNLDELFEKYRQAPDSFVFVPLADACRKTGQVEEALEICEKGVSRHPGYASGHVVKGKCLFDMGDRDGARRVFQHVLTLDENNLVALKFLGTIEADQGNLDIAQKHLQQILALDPDNKEIRQILRLVEEQEQMQLGTDDDVDDFDSEMDEVDEILDTGAPESSGTNPVVEATVARDELETSDELASITLADIFASQGYAEKAKKIYREVLRKQPESDLVRRKLAALSGEPVDDPVAVAIDVPVDNSEVPSLDIEPGADTPSEPARKPAAKPDKPYSKKSKRARRRAQKKSVSPPTHPPNDARPEIDEDDSRNHFQRWLNRVQN